MQNIKLQRSVTFVKKNFKINIWKKKTIVKFEIIVILEGNIEVLLRGYVIYLKCSVPEKIPIVFYNGSNFITLS